MSGDTVAAPTQESKSIFKHIARMPRWQKLLLSLASVALAAGVTGQTLRYLSRNDAAQAGEVGGPRSSFVQDAKAVEQDVEHPEPLLHRISPWLMRVGLAFIGGFVLGWALRTFVKVTATLAAVVVVAFLLLSYFNVFNVDLTRTEEQTKSAVEWMTDQGQRLGKLLMEQLPGSVSSFMGVFVGFRKK